MPKRLAGVHGRWNERRPEQDQGERCDPYADYEHVIAERISEDHESGDDRRQVRGNRRDGDHGDAVAYLQATSGGEERRRSPL